jgi:hypothetical protein
LIFIKFFWLPSQVEKDRFNTEILAERLLQTKDITLLNQTVSEGLYVIGRGLAPAR